MQIVIAASGEAVLEDAHNFRAFKVIFRGAPEAFAAAAAATGRVAPDADGPHLFVPVTWLAQHGPQDDAWIGGMMQMVAFAVSKGWADDTGAVRAHVEFADA